MTVAANILKSSCRQVEHWAWGDITRCVYYYLVVNCFQSCQWGLDILNPELCSVTQGMKQNDALQYLP
jgi:hypothetical protein